jgi:hypothetical protein
MSTKKKATAPKTPEPKYAIDQLVYTIVRHKGKAEEIIQIKVLARSKREIALRDMSGKKVGTESHFSYYAIKPDGFTQDFPEVLLYPSFFEAAKVFAKEFLKLL